LLALSSVTVIKKWLHSLSDVGRGVGEPVGYEDAPSRRLGVVESSNRRLAVPDEAEAVLISMPFGEITMQE
jgi:hypothetical protein